MHSGGRGLDLPAKYAVIFALFGIAGAAFAVASGQAGAVAAVIQYPLMGLAGGFAVGAVLKMLATR